MFWPYLLLFLASCFILAWSGSRLVSGLSKIARFLGWREFVVAFFIMAVGGSFPDLFVGINAAIHHIPQLSLGDIIGSNMVDLTLAVSLSVLIGGSNLPAKSRLIQNSAIFTAGIAILPVILILDGKLGRIDGFILILAFILYMVWLFSKSERFKKEYNPIRDKKEKEVLREEKISGKVKSFFNELEMVVFSLALLLLASEGIVLSAKIFASTLEMSLPLVGILIVGLGNSLPETYFAIISARKKEAWMILGDLMGSVIIGATLVLGIVAFISPITITSFSTFFVAAVFMFIAAIFFLIIVRTGQKVSKKESSVLLAIYLIFVIFEMFIR